MAAQATVTLTDAEGTPVNHPFDPSGVENGIAKWVDRTGGIAIGFPILTQSIREVSGGPKPGQVITQKLVFPVLEVVSGSDLAGYAPVPQVAYECEVDIRYRFSNRATLQIRKNVRAMVDDLLSEQVTKDYVETLAPAW